MLNGTCTLLQVQGVITVILCTETQWENAIENSKNAIQVWVWVWVRTQKKKQCGDGIVNLIMNEYGCYGKGHTLHSSGQIELI